VRQKSRSPVPRRSTAARSPRWRTRCARPAAPVDLLIYRLQQWRVTADPVIVSSGRPVGRDHSKPAKIPGHPWKTRLKVATANEAKGCWLPSHAVGARGLHSDQAAHQDQDLVRDRTQQSGALDLQPSVTEDSLVMPSLAGRGDHCDHRCVRLIRSGHSCVQRPNTFFHPAVSMWPMAVGTARSFHRSIRGATRFGLSQDGTGYEARPEIA
jgi:hypothetical protein